MKAEWYKNEIKDNKDYEDFEFYWMDSDDNRILFQF